MIPKIIHQIWHSPVYASDAGSPESWKTHNRDWTYRLWNFEHLEDLVAAEFPELLHLYRSYPNMVQRVDLARYVLLYRFGGIYADMDTDCLAPLDPIAAEDRVVLCEEPRSHWGHARAFGKDRIFFSAIMASPAGHPFWRHVIDLVWKCRHAASKDVLLSTGPMLLSGAVWSWPARSDLSLTSCHLFTPLDRDGKPAPEAETGDYAGLRLARHHWEGSWLGEKPETRWSRLKGQMRGWRASATRPKPLTFEEAMKRIERDELLSSPPAFDPTDLPNVAIFVPVKDGAQFIARHFELIGSLDYPKDKLRLVYCEGDSTDDSRIVLEAFRNRYRAMYRDIAILEHATGLRIKRNRRWKPQYQMQRRQALAKARNALIDGGLADDEWVLWLDVDVCDFAPDTLQTLMKTGAKIVAPNCVKEPGGPSFDHNAFLQNGEPRPSQYVKQMKHGLFQPPVEYPHRLHLHDMRCLDEVPLTGVGGTMLLVHASVHRSGLHFPEFPYKDLLETEAFGVLANDAGLRPLGLPNVEISHVNS